MKTDQCVNFSFEISDLRPGMGLWLGAVDFISYPHWTWDDFERLDYKAWAPGQPGMSQLEQCMMVNEKQVVKLSFSSSLVIVIVLIIVILLRSYCCCFDILTLNRF